MTSPSRKKRQTTVPNSPIRRTTNRRNRLAGPHWSTAMLISGIAFGLGPTSSTLAQQSTAWSPQPFAKPSESNSTREIPVPQNSLRTPKTTEEGNVLRWKTVIGDGKPASDTRNEASTASKLSSTPDSSPSNIIRQPANASKVADGSLPRSSFKLSGRKSAEANAPAGESYVQLASHNSPQQNRAENTRNGVWYDRVSGTTAQSDVIVIGSAEARESKSPSPANPIQRVRHQEPQSDGLDFSPRQLPPGLLPKAGEPEAAEESMNEQTESVPLNEPPKLEVPPKSNSKASPKNNSQSAPKNQSRSLLDEEDVPSPFPRNKPPKANSDSSPSDDLSPPEARKDLDRAPAPPKRRSSVNCDSLRQLINEADITKIRVDSSPGFVEGYKTRGRESNNTKEGFIKSSPIRTWTGLDGNVIAEGRLIDIAYGEVVLERANGSRTSFLLRKLSEQDQVYVAEKWGIPVTCSVDDGSFPSRNFTDTTVTWKASGACHKPLYFEDVQLERYGHEWGPVAQPFLSTAHFFGNVAVLPYKMGIHPINECQYALGYYRPGSCAPWTVGPVPISLRGALMQAKAVTGAALIIP